MRSNQTVKAVATGDGDDNRRVKTPPEDTYNNPLEVLTRRVLKRIIDSKKQVSVL